MSEKYNWWENETFTFFRVPKALIDRTQYPDLSAEGALLYGLLLDRMCLSSQNKDRFTDKQGNVFIYFTIRNICDELMCSKPKATKLLKELERNNLIFRKKQGLGKPDMLYALKFKQAVKNTELRTKENLTSKGSEICIPEAKNLYPNNTEYNNTYVSDNYPSIARYDYEDTISHLKEQFEYESLSQQGSIDLDLADEIILIMADTICSTAKTVRLGKQDIPTELMRSRFFSLNADHLEYVIDCFKSNTSKVRNVRSYLLTSLYNAPTTLQSYYQAEVSHDMAELEQAPDFEEMPD